MVGIEPNARAAELARAACDEVFAGRLEDWIATEDQRAFDGVLLSDVLEHLVDPVGALRALGQVPGLARAIWIVSVPNYAVWYNRLLTLGGHFRYRWSGLYDRTHLRFFTRQSLRELLEFAGFDLLGVGCSPSLVQAGAPLWRRWFEREVDAGQHLALTETPAYGLYHRYVEPLETAPLPALARAARLPDRRGGAPPVILEPSPRGGSSRSSPNRAAGPPAPRTLPPR